MFFIDHRLAKLVKIEREILAEMKRQYYEKKAEQEFLTETENKPPPPLP
jgi:hypothetical protein